eukprot:738054-Amphidinium_carterae.1
MENPGRRGLVLFAVSRLVQGLLLWGWLPLGCLCCSLLLLKLLSTRVTICSAPLRQEWDALTSHSW